MIIFSTRSRGSGALATNVSAAGSEAIGVSRKTVNTVENGVFVPSTVIALKLAAVLGRPVEELFFLVE